jgi:hypothetical protein
MANLYFCQSINRNLGILRAALSWEEGKNLLDQLPAIYVGQQFPTSNADSTPDFAVLRIFDEESDDGWRVGFYRFSAGLGRIEEAIQAYATNVSNVEEHLKSKV